MRFISDPTIRQYIKTYLRDQRKIPNANVSIRNLADVDEYMSVITDAQFQAKSKLKKHLKFEIDMGRLFVLSVGVSSLEFNGYFGKYAPLLPKDWITKDGKPDLNLLFECMFVQLANYSLGVLQLAEYGLEGPARALLRSLLEGTWKTIILLGDKEILRDYVGYSQEHRPAAVWQKYFRKEKALKSLEKIETSVGFRDSTIASLREDRKGLFSFYSEAVHHSIPATIHHSYVDVFGEKDLKPSIWGKESKSIQEILATLNRTLFYHTLVCSTLLKKLGFFPNTTPALEISRCALATYYNCYAQPNSESEKISVNSV